MTESLPAPEHKVNEEYNTWYVGRRLLPLVEHYNDFHFFNLECGLTLHVNDTRHDWKRERSGIEGHISTRRDIIWELNAHSLDLSREGQKRKVYWPSVEVGKSKIILAARDVLGRNLEGLPGGLDMEMIRHVMNKVAEDLVKTGGEKVIFESERLEIHKNGFVRDNTDPDGPSRDYLIKIKTPPDGIGNKLSRGLFGGPEHDENADKEFWTNITHEQYQELCRALWSPLDPHVHKNLPKTPDHF